MLLCDECDKGYHMVRPRVHCMCVPHRLLTPRFSRHALIRH